VHLFFPLREFTRECESVVATTTLIPWLNFFILYLSHEKKMSLTSKRRVWRWWLDAPRETCYHAGRQKSRLRLMMMMTERQDKSRLVARKRDLMHLLSPLCWFLLLSFSSNTRDWNHVLSYVRILTWRSKMMMIHVLSYLHNNNVIDLLALIPPSSSCSLSKWTAFNSYLFCMIVNVG
jgi:hypothetical protein